MWLRVKKVLGLIFQAFHPVKVTQLELNGLVNQRLWNFQTMEILENETKIFFFFIELWVNKDAGSVFTYHSFTTLFVFRSKILKN